MPTPTVSSGLIYHLPLDGDGGELVVSDDATLNGGVGFTGSVPSALSGVYSQSLDCDGVDDEAASSATGLLNSLDEFSISAWVYFDSVINNGTLVRASGFQFNFNINGLGRLQLSLRTSGLNGNVQSGNAVVTGQWYHLGVCYNSADDEIKFFRDGSLFSTHAFAGGAVEARTESIKVGGHGSYLNAQYSDVRIYNRELTPSEYSEIHAGDYSSEASGSPIRTRMQSSLSSRLQTSL